MSRSTRISLRKNEYLPEAGNSYGEGSNGTGNTLEIVVQATGDQLGAEIEKLHESGAVSQPLYVQTRNALRQADHFADSGKMDKAGEFMSRFKELVEQAGLTGTAWTEAKRNLLAASNDLLARWGRSNPS
jgi:hypothetical protein